MKTFLKNVSKAVLLVPALVLSFSFVTAGTAYAATDCSDVTSGGIGSGADCAKPKNAATQLFGENSIFQVVTNILLFLIGAISVIMLIIGGIRYVVSSGDQAAITGAKNTILYAIIGIVVAFLAFAAVRFVTDQLQKSATGALTSNVAIVRH